jgi:predicted nucleic acid-binding protein
MYLDTSSLVAYYLPEKKSSLVQEIVTSERTIHISHLTETEILSAFNKKVRVGEIDKEKSDEAYQIFQNHRKQNAFQVFELTDDVFKSSQMILKVTSLPIRTLDALHLGVVYSNNIELFSLDNIMNETADEFEIPIFKI